MIRRSKTDQEGLGPQGGHPPGFPVTALADPITRPGGFACWKALQGSAAKWLAIAVPPSGSKI
jgi:hypothetical protein